MLKRFPIVLAILALAAASRGLGADFVRGDANGDGEVTLADAIYILTRLTEEGALAEDAACPDAMDVDDDGEIYNTDGVLVFYHAIDGRAIAAPYPAAGPDPTADELGCDSQEAVEPLEGGVAELAVQDVRVSGSEDREVVVRLNLSSSVRVGSFVAEVELPDGLVPISDSDEDLTGRLSGGLLRMNDDTPGRVGLGLLPDVNALHMIPPRDDAPAIEFRACLEPGTPAGTYPLTLISAQLASETGRPIEPDLLSGILTVDADVEDVPCPLPPRIVPFVRGDVNSDGVVSLSDVQASLRWMFRGDFENGCGDAADVNDDGMPDITDAIELLRFFYLGFAAPAAPYPEPGADPTEDTNEHNVRTDERWPCTAPADNPPIEDEIAAIRVLDGVSPGGADRRAILRLATTNSRRIGGYDVRISTGGIFEARDSLTAGRLGLADLTGTLTNGFVELTSDPSSGEILVGFLPSFTGDVGIPPGLEQPVLEFHLCLQPGTPAGEYPLTLTSSEFVDSDTSLRIIPELNSGVLTILEDVAETECVLEEIPPPPGGLQVEYRLEDTVGAPGLEVVVPLTARVSDHAVSNGLKISVDYDPETLELVEIEEILPRPDGEPWAYRLKYIDPAEGTITGRFVYSGLGFDDFSFPTREEFTALGLRFRIADDVRPGTEIPITFDDGNPFCFETVGTCYPWQNAILSGQLELPASQIDSLILIGGTLKIIGEVTTFFVRGDSNSDDEVDISDPIFTLGHLFLGTRAPSCEDAADANDDGILDISDVMATLGALFLSEGPLPSPSGIRGPDPTADALGCLAVRG